MRVRLLWLVAVLALGGIAGLLITRDPGYVLVAYDRMAIETSLWFALLLLALGYVFIRIAAFVIVRLLRGRGALTRWNSERRARAADQRTLRGLEFMAAGRWAEARKQLTRAAPRAGAPAVNLLGAATAAQRLGDLAGRDSLLREAREQAPDETAAVDFTLASLDHEAGRWAEARQALERVRVQQPSHPEALWLLADCCRRLGDWHAVAELVPLLKRERSRPAPALHELESAATVGRLTQGGEPAARVWATLSKAQRHEPLIALSYGRAVEAAQPDDAERAVREALQRGWDEALVEWYGRVASSDPARQLAVAEGWRKAHPDDPVLLLTLGRLALQNRRWAEAREYFESSVRLAPTAVARGELGRLCAALGEARGTELLIEALAELPALPLPGSGAQPAVRDAVATTAGE